MKKSFLSLLVTYAMPLCSAQFCQMNSTEVIPINLSSYNHNRIGIVGDRIKKAFFNGAHISVDVEENSGHIYVQALRPNISTTLSLISFSGVLQELELNFMSVSSEIVLLQPEVMCEEEISWANCEDSDLTGLVDGFLKGEIPEGYVSFEDCDGSREIKKGLKLKRFSRMVNESQIVFALRLHNESCVIQQIRECQVNILDGDWVFLDRFQLKPNECALVLIGCYR